MRGQRKKSLVHTVCSVPPGFLGILEMSVNSVRYISLCENMPSFPATDHTVWTMHEGGNKLFTFSNYLCVCPFQLNVMACD